MSFLTLQRTTATQYNTLSANTFSETLQLSNLHHTFTNSILWDTVWSYLHYLTDKIRMVIAYTCMSLESKLHGQRGFLAIQMKRDVSLESDKLTSHALLCIYYRTRIYRRLLKLESTLNGLLRLTFVVYEYLKFLHDSDHAKCGGVLFRLRLLYFCTLSTFP